MKLGRIIIWIPIIGIMYMFVGFFADIPSPFINKRYKIFEQTGEYIRNRHIFYATLFYQIFSFLTLLFLVG